MADVADTCGVTSYEEYEPEPPRGWSPGTVALVATLVLLLGLGGAVFGIHAAHTVMSASDTPSGAATATLTPQLSGPTGSSPAASPSPAAVGPSAQVSPGLEASASSSEPFSLIDVTGVDFRDARSRIRVRRLGWRLIFEGTDATDATVRTTDPAPGSLVRAGDTVKIYVRGAAPLALVPDVVGFACADAASRIIDSGVYPQYPLGRDGIVVAQSPPAGDPGVRWNDTVRLSCVTSG
jgi:hypothetical protein